MTIVMKEWQSTGGTKYKTYRQNNRDIGRSMHCLDQVRNLNCCLYLLEYLDQAGAD